MFLSTIVEDIQAFFEDNLVLRIILDSYFVLILISFIVFLCFKFKKAIFLSIIGIFLGLIAYFSPIIGLSVSQTIYPAVFGSYIVICFIILAPELRKLMEYHKDDSNNQKSQSISTTQRTIEAVSDAVFDMAAVKVGALITFEQHISLEQYSERAITLNSDISKELLEQIFIKDSPLHDGGVIIRNNRIVCAAAYYTLTQDTSLEKTVGSRHRAGVGISEMTDSLTIIVSEETGSVHIANQGFMIAMDSKNDLIDYLTTYLGRA